MSQTTGIPSVTSRRRPYPWDLVIAGTGVILKPSEEGLMVGKKLQTLANVAPVTYDYSSQPVYAERTYPFRRLVGGYGERVQQTTLPTRYRYAINADLSVGAMAIKGPLVHTVTPSSSGSVEWFADALHGASLATFAGAGRYVLRRSSDVPAGWVVSRDFGVGRTVTKAVRFQSAGIGMVDSLYVVLDNGELWRYNGSAWVTGAQTASTIAALREEFWISDTPNTVRKCVADPLLGASYGAAIVVGSADSAITNLEVLGNTLFVFKTDGIYTVNANTTTNTLFADLRQQRLSTNGLRARSWLGRLWFGYGDGYYFLKEDGGLTPAGPGLLLENDTEVRGNVVGFEGHASWFGYYALYNPDNEASYLIKHGTWMNPEERETAEYRFEEVPNGAIVKWAGKRITSIRQSSVVAGNTRLYFGFADGSIDWILLPTGSPNPSDEGSGCEFTDQESYIYWPLHHAMFQADAKSYRGFSVFGPEIDDDNHVRVQYRTGNVESYNTPGGAWTDVGVPFVYSGQRHNLPVSTQGFVIEVRHQLVSLTAGTPVVEGVALHEAVRPSLLLEYTWTVNARRYLARRDGVVDRRSPTQIREVCRAAAASIGAVDIVLPEQITQSVSIVDYSEALAPVTKRFGVEWDIAMKGVEFQTLTSYGTWDRVGAYTWDDIALMTWDDLLYL